MDTAAPSSLLTIEEASARLHVPAREVKKAIAIGSLSHVRLGKHTRIHPVDLEDYRQRHTVKAWAPPR